MQKKILITGGAGFVGSYLAEKLISDANNYVVIVDDLSTGFKENLPQNTTKNWRFIKADVNDYKDISPIILSFGFDYVFHYAALVGVKRTQKHPVKVLRDIHGLENILTLSKNTLVKRVFFSSSSEVYGEPTELPQNEDTTPLNSRIPYAVVKNVGESFLKSYQKEFGLNYTIFRFFNTYGPKQSVDFVMSRFINLALQNEDITIYGDGNQTRTFCYVQDNVDACVSAFNNDLYINDVINIGSDYEIKIFDLAKLIIKLCKSKSRIKHMPPLPEGDMNRRFPDVSKMHALLNRKPISIEEGIKRILTNPTFLKRS
ncbi:MAG: NAD-dependent epimerase/dehydratase family protein [Bacteroidales bacterium]|nr:NAD-dependent epimerase/dehydratase family protein [Bacteroidales bacterium]